MADAESGTKSVPPQHGVLALANFKLKYERQLQVLGYIVDWTPDPITNSFKVDVRHHWFPAT